jgi:hypothetical protein
MLWHQLQTFPSTNTFGLSIRGRSNLQADSCIPQTTTKSPKSQVEKVEETVTIQIRLIIYICKGFLLLIITITITTAEPTITIPWTNKNVSPRRQNHNYNNIIGCATTTTNVDNCSTHHPTTTSLLQSVVQQQTI